YKLAVIVAETSFEAFVQFRIDLECRIRAISSLTDKRGTTRTIEDALMRGDLKRDLLGDYAFQLCGKDVKSISEYQRWNEDTYKLRNEIIHRGRMDVTEEQAKQAVSSAVAY